MLGFLLFALLLPAMEAAPLERDLGDGLIYFRVKAMPADLPAADAVRKQPCVLDLRYAKADGAPQVFAAWLKFHASPRTPVFVLVNGSTAPALQAVLASHDRLPGVLTIGIAGQNFEPDIVVADSAEHERQAFDALEKGSKVAELTTDHPTKMRNDEASLTHEQPVDPSLELSDGSAAKRPADDAGAAPKDAALQRAIHLHRGLRAMKKL